MHYLTAVEIGRQRHQEIARSVERRQPLRAARRRWWERGFLRHPATARDVPSPAPGRASATA